MEYFTQQSWNLPQESDRGKCKTDTSVDMEGSSDRLFFCSWVRRRVPLAPREELYHILRMTGPLVRIDTFTSFPLKESLDYLVSQEIFWNVIKCQALAQQTTCQSDGNVKAHLPRGPWFVIHSRLCLISCIICKLLSVSTAPLLVFCLSSCSLASSSSCCRLWWQCSLDVWEMKWWLAMD